MGGCIRGFPGYSRAVRIGVGRVQDWGRCADGEVWLLITTSFRTFCVESVRGQAHAGLVVAVLFGSLLRRLARRESTGGIAGIFCSCRLPRAGPISGCLPQPVSFPFCELRLP